MLTQLQQTLPPRVSQAESSAPESVDADIGTGLLAHNLGDMRVFINLADFVCGILPGCGPGMFSNWASLATLDLVGASSQRPLLSGFYRMLTVTMKLTSTAGMPPVFCHYNQLTRQNHGQPKIADA